MTYHAHNQEPHSSNEPECCETSDTPEHNSQVDICNAGLVSILLIVCDCDLQTASLQYHSGETQITEHPEENDTRSKPLVVVFLLVRGRLDFLLFLPFGAESLQLFLVHGVQIGIIGWSLDVSLSVGFGGH